MKTDGRERPCATFDRLRGQIRASPNMNKYHEASSPARSPALPFATQAYGLTTISVPRPRTI